MLDLLRKRRSCRQFSTRPLTFETLETLKEAALRAPSSRNLMPWKFHFIQDPALLSAMAQCKPHGADFLAHCPLGIVVTGNPEIADTWVEDCSIAAITLQYTAQSLDLGSCWVQVRLRGAHSPDQAEQVMGQLLGIEPPWRTLCVLAVGYPAQTLPPRPLSFLKKNRLASLGE